MIECVVRMEKPKSCEACDLAVKYQRFGTEICCPFMGWYANYDKCPIILQLPENHGRLGDLDELAAGCDAPYWCRWLSEIEDAATIVPATERRGNDSQIRVLRQDQ